MAKHLKIHALENTIRKVDPDLADRLLGSLKKNSDFEHREFRKDIDAHDGIPTDLKKLIHATLDLDD